MSTLYKTYKVFLNHKIPSFSIDKSKA